MALRVYNSLSRELEVFEPLHPPYVGMYVCGPTVYGDAHIGHAKSYISFDLVVRYLRFLGYQVRYVQNITDVGHLTDDADQGEDKIEKRAALDKVHPIQLAQSFERRFFEDMDALGLVRPDISPRATGHIPEQIALTEKLLANGHAYEAGGNVYFDVTSFPAYGKLSHRRLEEQAAGTRFEVRGEKRHPADFALWKKAEPGHILQWPSPWGLGYPGWHVECSAMSQKYLGETFDIHGGGLENIFPHHEDEVAQSEAACGQPFAKYWLHNNMVTVNGQKMGKSLGNFVTLREAFKKFDPMVLRMVILQGHYRSPFDYSEAALEAAKAGYERLTSAVLAVRGRMSVAPQGGASEDLKELAAGIEERFRTAMDDDFGSSSALAALFDIVGPANTMARDKSVTRGCLVVIEELFRRLGTDVLGIIYRPPFGMQMTEQMLRLALASAALDVTNPTTVSAKEDLGGALRRVDSALTLSSLFAAPRDVQLIQLLIDVRAAVRREKLFALSDQVRDGLTKLGVKLEDGPEGTTWRLE